MDDEILLVDKPAEMTSFGVVARVRRILSEREGRRVKVGHAGTLDPFATGLLVLGVGKGTKRLGEFLKLDKVYVGTLRLGSVSTTGDPEGEISGYLPAEGGMPLDDIDFETISRVLPRFRGEIEQRPPMYSAIRVNGERAYRLARRGEKVDMPLRKVHIYDIGVLRYEWPELVVRVHCSSGAYIRTLAEDIGKELGCGAYLTALRRTKIGQFDVKDAKSLEQMGKVW